MIIYYTWCFTSLFPLHQYLKLKMISDNLRITNYWSHIQDFFKFSAKKGVSKWCYGDIGLKWEKKEIPKRRWVIHICYLSSLLYTSKDQFTFLCNFACPVRLKRGIRTVRAKTVKNTFKTSGIANHRWSPSGPTQWRARQPAETRLNQR